MDCIDNVYQRLSKLNLAHSMSYYSNHWLGMEKSYYRNKLCKRRSASARVYGRLAKRLMQEAAARRMMGQKTQAKEISELASACINAILLANDNERVEVDGVYRAN
jgi:hypothetical protein